MKKGPAIISAFLAFLLIGPLLVATAGTPGLSPVISSISPDTYAAGTFTVKIIGSNFKSVGAVGTISTSTGTEVRNTTTYVVNSPTQITATTTLAAGTYYFRIVTNYGTADSPGLAVSPPLPTIPSVSPTTSVAGTYEVATTGSNFTAVKAVATDNGSGNLITNPTYTTVSESSNKSPNQPQTGSPPVISGISPTTNSAGAFNVLISGSNFANVQAVGVYDAASGNAVANATYKVKSANKFTASVNLPAGSFYFRVTTSYGVSNNSPILMVSSPPPTISSISPTTAVAGTLSVTISGNNFANVQAVKAISTSTGAQVGESYVVNSSSQITATANLSADTYYLQVSTAAGTANSPNLVVSSPAPPPPPSGTTTYKLNSTIPAIVNDGTVSQGVSTSGYRTMWRGLDNNVHLLACFGGDSNSGWFGHYINMNTGAHKMISGPSKGAAMWWTYNPAADRVYIATSYAQYNESLWEFNAADQSLVMVSPTADHYSSLNLITGDDNRVYWATQWNQLFSYDHATNTFKSYGTVLPGLQTGSNYFSLGADTGYVYCGVLKLDGTRTLAISPTTGSPNFTEWEFGNAGDTGLSISTKLTTHEWICTRTLADGSKKVYYLANGTYTDSGQTSIQDEYHQDLTCRHCVMASDENSYPSFSSTYSWDCDMTDLFPIKAIHEFSEIKYRPTGTSSWSDSGLPFTGPWVPQAIQCLALNAGNIVLAVSAGYNACANLDYLADVPTYLGANNFSPYTTMNHPSCEIYVGGYSNSVLRYNPIQPWTMTSSNKTPTIPSDPNKPNPYFIKMSGDTYHYRHGLDYDLNGVVWIGGNTTRAPNPPGWDYGNVMWYNPTDGTNGYMFPAWKTTTNGVCFRNLCAAANRSKIVVASNDGYLTVIDAATKTIDGTYNLSEYAYMIDVNGVVVGVTPAGNIFRFNPLTRTMLTAPQNIGVSGTPFGFGNSQYSRMNYKLELAPDGYIWMFVGNSLYRIDPNTCVFSKVLDAAAYSKISFAPNRTDLLLYLINGTTDFKYFPGILEPVSP